MSKTEELSTKHSTPRRLTHPPVKADDNGPTETAMLVRSTLWAVLLAFSILRTISWLHVPVYAFLIYVLTGGWRYVLIRLKTAPRDIKAGVRFIELSLHLRRYKYTNATVVSEFLQNTRNHPNKPCIIVEDRTWTFKDIDKYSNQISNIFANAGYKKGDVFALLMENCAEYVAVWLGLAKIGICTALINTNLRQKPLFHCVQVSKAKVLIFGKELLEAVKDIQQVPNDHDQNWKYYCLGDFDANETNAQPLSKILQNTSNLPPPKQQLNTTDKLVYIYTSGTTGLPKPAIISHSRYMYMAIACACMMPIRHDDIIYIPLPLYHSAGGTLGMGQALVNGATVAVRKKFSASQYWTDCIKYKCTAAQYIGEICRYLLCQPEKPTDTQHSVRLMYGNGLRPQIWSPFVNRFKIKHLREIYGSTEGNANIMNLDNQPNAIGFMPVSLIAKMVYPVMLIRIDENTNEPLRGKDGLCIRCQPGEPGEFVGKIIKSDPTRDFLGYVGESATQKKIVRDVFKKGDMAFLSGDLLVMDELGYLYFKDRLGDTFRWRGENVSTSEVEGVIIDVIGLKECTVYGTEVPGCEGRAGMAAIVDEEGNLDLKTLSNGVVKSLAAYARPLFIRIVQEIDMTGTYKLKKVELQKQGINPNSVAKDKLYYMDLKTSQYLPLDQDAYEKICDGKIRF